VKETILCSALRRTSTVRVEMMPRVRRERDVRGMRSHQAPEPVIEIEPEIEVDNSALHRLGASVMVVVLGSPPLPPNIRSRGANKKGPLKRITREVAICASENEETGASGSHCLSPVLIDLLGCEKLPDCQAGRVRHGVGYPLLKACHVFAVARGRLVIYFATV
jgi:hypothetical protein